MGKNDWRRRSGWRRKIQDYFDDCDAQGKKYTPSGLKVALGADEETWSRLTGDPMLKDLFELAMARIQDGLEQREDQMAVLLMRRGEYGGGTAGGPARLEVRFGDGGRIEEYGG